MWSDNETSIDLLGFQHLTKAACDIVKNKRLLPATIGIYGDRGSGKSSLIQMVKAELEKDEDIVVLSFNGWLFEVFEDAKTALMGTILEELLSHRNFLRKASEEAKKLGKRLLKACELIEGCHGDRKARSSRQDRGNRSSSSRPIRQFRSSLDSRAP